ncbi:TIR domain-containing protein [Lacinutrix himadriensis]|uniref:TIR domain-containing protein n=1 Tax=Lacinutrix himadriensis TaxID=641549 RepID=UPI0006E29D63|nr:TIR domain-containing protein [Lacinutrix himadriensis]
MKEITDIETFTSWLFETEADDKLDEYCFSKKNYCVASGMLEISGLKVDEEDVDDKHFSSTKFINCTFKSTNFKSAIFGDCEFINCYFINCEFTWVKLFNTALTDCTFDYCTIAGMELNDSETYSTKFKDSNEILDLIIRGFGNRDLTFLSCYLNGLSIEPIQNEFSDKLFFEDCIIKESSFDRIDFSDSIIENCTLSLNQFSACTFGLNTFKNQNSSPGSEFNMIDIRSILNSPPINDDNLKTLFGIHNSEIKEYLFELTSEIKFQSIFISYSFEDHEFAKAINEFLLRKGVFTFLWENNSTAGELLNHIMESNINEKDRILFIASENSIKSKACQFELTQGQKKQEITWEKILFPIHIDDFLFKVTKEQIRPSEKQNEYWSNISELKKHNSLDFTEYINKENRKSQEFEKLMFRLLKGLQK